MPDANGPTPTLPISGYGQQNTDGNSSNPLMGTMTITAIGSYTGSATVTVNELLSGLLSYTGSGHTLTLPTAALIDAALVNAKTGRGAPGEAALVPVTPLAALPVIDRKSVV